MDDILEMMEEVGFFDDDCIEPDTDYCNPKHGRIKERRWTAYTDETVYEDDYVDRYYICD